MNITFKVAKLGSAVREFFAPNGTTKVSDALALADTASEGYDVSVNGTPATPDSPVHDKDTIYLVPRLKAGL